MRNNYKIYFLRQQTAATKLGTLSFFGWGGVPWADMVDYINMLNVLLTSSLSSTKIV